MLVRPIACRSLATGCYKAVVSSVKYSNTAVSGGLVSKALLNGTRSFNYKSCTGKVSLLDRTSLGLNRRLGNRCFCSKVNDSSAKDLNVKDNDGSTLFDNIDIDEITEGNGDLTKKLKLIMLEVDVMRQEGLQVPSKLKSDEWKEMLNFATRSQRVKMLRFLWLNEKKAQSDKLKKERKKVAREEMYEKLNEDLDENAIRYALNANTIFIRYSDTAMNAQSGNRLIQAMKFGQDFVIDCGYDEYMSYKEASNCAKQLMYVFAQNRSHVEPFNLHFCNANFKGRTMEKLKKNIPTMFDLDYPMNVSEKHYLELFPKEKLVYLTPHCKEDLTAYSHDDIYIMGAMVDKANCEPLSLARAKSEGLRMAKFPLERYLSWSCGSKSLTLDQCLMIMLEMKMSGDWEKAFTHVPRRKLFAVDKGDDDSIDIPVARFGQSYVNHEWGPSKKRDRRQIKSRYVDLRNLLEKKG